MTICEQRPREVRKKTMWVSGGRAARQREKLVQRLCNDSRVPGMFQEEQETCVAGVEVREVRPVRSEKSQLTHDRTGPHKGFDFYAA